MDLMKGYLLDKILRASAYPLLELPAVDHYAGSERFIRKALVLQAEQNFRFDVTLDCEDGAQAGSELHQVEMICSLLSELDPIHERRLGVRVYPWSGATARLSREAVRSVIKAGRERLRYLTLPKVSSVKEVLAAARFIGSVAKRERVPAPNLHVLIETQGALRDAGAIARVPLVQSLDFGIMDFISEHDGAIPRACMATPGQFEHELLKRAKVEIVAAALAAGKAPTHNVSLALDNPASVRADAARAREQFGFLRMWSVHPSQIAAINEGMTPVLAEIEEAARVLCAARRADWAPIRIDSQLYDRASYRLLWSVLKRALRAGKECPSEALVLFESV